MILKNLSEKSCEWLNSDTATPFISTRIRYARNLAGFVFPSRANPSEQLKARNAVFRALVKLPEWERYEKIEMEELDITDRRLLMERHMASYDLVFTERVSGLVIDKSGLMCIMLNEEDHLRIQVFARGLDFGGSSALGAGVSKEISSVLKFAFHPEFGYLTACPTNAGTGLRISFLAHLPALSREGLIGELMDSLGRIGVVMRGFYGEATKPLGNFFQVSNQVTMGVTEDEITEKLTAISNQLEKTERRSSDKLFKKNKMEILDRIYRSYGILQFARKLSYEELMSCVSDIRWGLREGMAIPVGGDKINDLIMLAQPAHIEERAEKNLTPDERDVLRAEFVKQILN
ncbi:MAG: ATP--guanido phosphotransferase [Elusimicrobia bacterium CG08_land_8_20_14_0_20_44_26]|nr:MAG: ATP--guanido phosphotransferase [Elusimicrobia bacterium CG08_land_8_20_14_0_20_44_26]